MELTEIVVFKLFAPFAKIIFSWGGFFAQLLVQIVSPEKIEKKELRYRLYSSVIAIPAVMSLDSIYDFNKWVISFLTIVFGLFMWLVLDIAKKKLPKKLGDYIDNYKV